MPIELPIVEVRRKHPLAKCEECPLQSEVIKPVPSIGPDRAKLAIVGEAPGVQEARKGIPFIGVSGRLLNTVLTHYNLQRSDIFLTNACLCRPADGSTPTKQAVEACNPRLVAELNDRVPDRVVALGNTAAQALVDTRMGITLLRVGPGRTSRKVPGAKIIPTFHPAACLRNPDSFPSLVADFAKINQDLSAWTPPTITVADTQEEALSYLDQILPLTDKLVIDIEVGVEKDISFGHPNEYDLLSVGIGYAKGKVLVLGEEALKFESVRWALATVLEHKKIICHNGKFDLAGLYSITKGTATLWFDTMLASYCLDERPGQHGLKMRAVEDLGAPQYDEEVKRYVGPKDSYAVIPRPVLYKYNAYDVACTWDLYEVQLARLEDEELRRLHDFLVAASNQLMYLELNGLAVDRRYLDELTDSYLDVIDAVEAELNTVLTRAGMEGINPRSPQQVKKTLAAFGVEVDSTAKESLEAIKDHKQVKPESDLFAFVDTLLKHRREAKLYGTYVKGTRKRLYGGRVYPTFLLHGSVTGRLACRNPNLQNVPRESKIRRLFVPSKPENVFVQADYSQAELRVVTWLAQDEYFRSIFNDPTRDLFDELTPVLYPDADPGLKKSNPAAYKELRIRVKAYVYGLSYGREAYSIAQEFKIPEREAQQGMNRFFEAIPGIVEWRKSVETAVATSTDLVSPFGRHRRFWLVTDENRKDVTKEALAFLPQSTASDICLSAAVELRPALRGRGFVRLLVHDSIMAECHRDEAEAVGQMMSETMVRKAQDVVGDYVRFATDVSIADNWGDL